jgi:genome maintenance exonuclease 1
MHVLLTKFFRPLRLVLVDWKTSQKPKRSLSATFDAPLQIAAYVGAINHDQRYPFVVHNALVTIDAVL